MSDRYTPYRWLTAVKWKFKEERASRMFAKRRSSQHLKRDFTFKIRFGVAYAVFFCMLWTVKLAPTLELRTEKCKVINITTLGLDWIAMARVIHTTVVRMQ